MLETAVLVRTVIAARRVGGAPLPIYPIGAATGRIIEPPDSVDYLMGDICTNARRGQNVSIAAKTLLPFEHERHLSIDAGIGRHFVVA